jgi:GNAT superfamily N-acetyltransferase
MSHDLLDKLNNPVWRALNSVQQQFGEGAAHIKRYRRGILPFAAYEHGTKENLRALDKWLSASEVFYLFGKLPPLPAGWKVVKELHCFQMLAPANIIAVNNTDPISLLTEAQSIEMYNLVNKVQPGYYERDTHKLGNYYGIWDKDKLVAIAGERIQLEQLTEVSAICTDPDYTGRKYAQQLTAHVCNKIIEKGNIPFLHVLQSNERAVGLYEYIGFSEKRPFSIWQLKKN